MLSKDNRMHQFDQGFTDRQLKLISGAMVLIGVIGLCVGVIWA